jgi:L,D-peptidoglycan transpeptidase YkuD (ErfK/YbiS/YcfS/YnhG family)
MVASLGRAGVVGAVDKIEGDGCTPAGIYSLGLVFGSELTVATAMPYRQATAEDVWVDDPAAVSYNTWVKGPLAGYSAEQLLRADGLYRYVIVIEYNTRPVVCGKGSAIFIHPWLEDLRPTAGCVALAEDNLRRLLAWLEPTKAPTIILQQADSEGGH